MFLVASTNTGDADEYECSHFAPYQVTIKIDEPPFDSVMDIADNTTPIIQQLWVYSILKELHQERDIDQIAE